MQKNKEHCLLYHREYVSGFGKAIKMPIWSSYTVPKPVSLCPLSHAGWKKFMALEYSKN